MVSNHTIATKVTILILAGIPLAIIRFVVSIIVNPLDGMLRRWTSFHVRNEILEPMFAKPSVTYRDIAVVFIGCAILVVASIYHAHVDVVLDGTREAVSPVGFGSTLLLVTARTARRSDATEDAVFTSSAFFSAGAFKGAINTVPVVFPDTHLAPQSQKTLFSRIDRWIGHGSKYTTSTKKTQVKDDEIGRALWKHKETDGNDQSRYFFQKNRVTKLEIQGQLRANRPYLKSIALNAQTQRLQVALLVEVHFSLRYRTDNPGNTLILSSPTQKAAYMSNGFVKEARHAVTHDCYRVNSGKTYSESQGNPEPSPSNGMRVDGKVQRLGQRSQSDNVHQRPALASWRVEKIVRSVWKHAANTKDNLQRFDGGGGTLRMDFTDVKFGEGITWDTHVAIDPDRCYGVNPNDINVYELRSALARMIAIS